MKKIFNVFIICIISIVLNSCKDTDAQCNGIYGSMSIKEFEYKDHSYIEFSDAGMSGMMVLHNPDCKCFQHMN